jgi:hypothetical protein
MRSTAPGAISSAGVKGRLNKLRESQGTMKEFKGRVWHQNNRVYDNQKQKEVNSEQKS